MATAHKIRRNSVLKKVSARPNKHINSEKENRSRLITLGIAALGVVFGDIGTSPLYAIRECFYGDYAIAASKLNILGVLSLIFWALIIVVTIKYLTFILRADNHGEGGIMALASLIRPKGTTKRNRTWTLVAIGIFGASLLYGDGMITPAISVMSALEGINVITPHLESYVVPLTIVILLGLFSIQSRGTGKVGRLFGPVIFVWFSTIGILGALEVVTHPAVLLAIWPGYALHFLAVNHIHGFLVLGAVFLVVTGAEALYADMGHFGPKPIRLVWGGLVLPALFFNYFGQGALLLRNPEAVTNPFYALVPSWGMIPMVFLAMTATIIASQAVISGAFSLTLQAVQLGYLPRIKIIHTSAQQKGQIYVPIVNWILMISTIALAVAFKSSSKLAAAYGVAVTATMLISTILFYEVAHTKWKWSPYLLFPLVGFFLIVDVSFFLANVSKILHGAWFPLVIGALVYVVMMTWRRGRELLGAQMKTRAISQEDFQKTVAENPPQRVEGEAVFLTGHPDVVPVSLLHNLKHNKILHSEVAFLHVHTEDVPRVPNNEKVTVEKLGGGLHRVTARYGYMERPNVRNILALAVQQGLEFRIETLSFFLGREKLTPSPHPKMSHWRIHLYEFMSRNALDASDYFSIPPSQVIELVVTLQL